MVSSKRFGRAGRPAGPPPTHRGTRMSTTTGDPLTRRSPSLWSRIVRHWQLYVLLAPAIIYLIVFKYWPMYGVQIAFRNYNPIDGFMGSEWVGLEHISRFLHSFQFT